MMDLLLSHAYFLEEDLREQEVMRPYPPLGLLYLSSHLKARGFQVGVFDSTFRGRDQFDACLARERPPVVGLYVNLLTRASALAMIGVAKRLGATVVLGGPEPASWAEEYLARGADVVVVGEGEHTLEELLPALRARGVHDLGDVRGVAYRDAEGRTARTPPRPFIERLDAQPFPDRAAVEIGDYLRAWRTRHGRGSVSLLAARGCPYRCRWCSHGVFGYTHRRRSPGNVADELAQVLEAYRPEMVWYADDVFTIHHPWLFAYAAELERRGLHVPFETISREDRLNEEVIRTLAGMGCFRLWIGAESGSQRVLDAMERRTDAARTREMMRLLQRHGIEAGTFVMLGYEGEEESDLVETTRHLAAALPDAVLTTVAYPIKGTPYHDDVADRVIPLEPWELGSDREQAVKGRHSRRYYGHAASWMLHEVAWRRELRGPRRSLARAARAFVHARRSRIGMMLTRGQVERGDGARA